MKSIAMKSLLPLLLSAGAISLALPVAAETLLIERVGAEVPGSVPARGQTMTQVQARFGAPSQRLDPRGGQKRQWPTINRWVYPAFTVYFERNTVIDVVVNQASAQEVGPKPPIL